MISRELRRDFLLNPLGLRVLGSQLPPTSKHRRFGKFRDITPIMENHLDKSGEKLMETGYSSPLN